MKNMIQHDPETDAKKRRLQMELSIKDSDFKRNERRRIEIDILMREIKRKKALLDVEVVRLDNELKRLASDQMMLDGEIKQIKKNINHLST